jgi:cysteine-rich repeat protein
VRTTIRLTLLASPRKDLPMPVRRARPLRLAVAFSALSLAAFAGCKKPVDDALVTFQVTVDAQVPTFANLLFAVTDPTGVPERTVAGDGAAHRSFRYGYYMPGVNGTVNIQGSAVDAVGCTIGQGALVVAGVVAGQTIDGGTLTISKVPIDCTTHRDAGADAAKTDGSHADGSHADGSHTDGSHVDGSHKDGSHDAATDRPSSQDGSSTDGGPTCPAGNIGCACKAGGVCDTGLACAQNVCHSVSCGDGHVDQGEECDDGNTVNTDACTNACKKAACGDGITETGVEECDDGNAVNTDACTNTCKLPKCGDGIVQSGEQCDDGATDNNGPCLMNCKTATCGDGYVERGVETCDDGNTVNSDSCSNTCKSATCGDGITQSNEQCDDANTSNTDGCLNDCTKARCGDGFVQAGVEACDDGNTNNDDSCTNNCTVARCGDGFVQGTEQCDDGNAVNNDGCTNACKLPVCGDAIVQGTEQCDDGNTSNADLCTNSCTIARCGDGFVQGTEQCDDGNAVNNDGCTNGCKLPACGDGILQAGEQCDDGNASNTDACTNACKAATCGDGFVQAGVEQCDDGNTSNTDSCTNACKPAACGDGYLQGTEACDDGNAVNTDACTNSCKKAACGDGIAETGVEECDDGNGVDTDSCTNACKKRYNIAFLSSATYQPEALGGPAGGDSKCQSLATAAGLPGTYVSWMNSTTSSVATRLGSARGWLRPDGKPFLDQFTTPLTTYYPPELTETGADVTTGQVLGGNTTATSGYECSDWTSTASNVSYYVGNASSGYWNNYGYGACSNLTSSSEVFHLYCLGKDFSSPLIFPKASGRLAFVLPPAAWSPKGGLAGADAACQSAATAASLSGTYLAMLATSTASMASRFDASGAPWVRVDGVALVTNASDLFTKGGKWLAPLETSATGVPELVAVWTGNSDPTAPAASVMTTCNDWTSNVSPYTGNAGESALTFVSQALGTSTPTCAASFSLYCLQK